MSEKLRLKEAGEILTLAHGGTGAVVKAAECDCVFKLFEFAAVIFVIGFAVYGIWRFCEADPYANYKKCMRWEREIMGRNSLGLCAASYIDPRKE